MKNLILVVLAASLLSGCAGSEWDLSNKCEAGNTQACERLDAVRQQQPSPLLQAMIDYGNQYNAQQAQQRIQQVPVQTTCVESALGSVITCNSF